VGRKAKYSKEVKIQACIDYDEGKGNFCDIAREISIDSSDVRKWYLRYKEHGCSVFNESNSNRSYSKDFKLQVINEYISKKYSITMIGARYNISNRVISNWIKKWYNGVEIKDYDPKGDVYTMKSRKTTFEERLEIVKWTIENNMSYKNAADKYSITYALVYKWTRDYIDKGPEALNYQKRGRKLKSEIDESSLTEVERLKIELEKERAIRKRREFELEVLKKKEELEKKLRYRK
jgi:transposase